MRQDEKTIEEAQLMAVDALAWATLNGFVVEGGQPLEFENHRFLLDPYQDISQFQAIRKCSQVGWSTLAIIKAFHFARYFGANIIYTLPTRNAAKEFVIPKVNPLIIKNPTLLNLVQETNSISLKQVHDRFIYFRGTYEETEAISTPADILIHDEYDRSKPSVLTTYRSRLKHSKLKYIYRFSNPSVPGVGVDEFWLQSDRKHWFIKCDHCGHERYIEWKKDEEYTPSVNHYIDKERLIYACGKCEKEISNEARRMGRWVKKYRDREISGYWLSHAVCPWISAKEIVDESTEDPSYFHNFILGEPFVSKDTLVDRKIILSCLVPGHNPKVNVAIGVDNGVTKHYVVGNDRGIFMVGETDDWDYIEQLRNRYNAYMVIDALPYSNMPMKLCKKYRGKVFMNYYVQDRKGSEPIRWGSGDDDSVVQSDRTKIIDVVVAELNNQEILFNMTEDKLETYIAHWQNIYRTTEETAMGVERPIWQTYENKPDHYDHATVYWRIAMEKAKISGGGGVRPQTQKSLGEKTVTVSEDLTVPVDEVVDIQKSLRLSGQSRSKKSWKTR